MADFRELYDRVRFGDARSACDAMRELRDNSGDFAQLGEHIGELREMLASKNSLVRNRALELLAAAARWDSRGEIDSFVGDYLNHINDEKPITARRCLASLPVLAAAKPQLRAEITAALRRADFSSRPNSMRPLLEKDAAQALTRINDMT